MVRLVDDEHRGRGQEAGAAGGLLAQHQIEEQEGVIDHHQVGLLRLGLGLLAVTALEEAACTPQAVAAVHRHLAAQVIGQRHVERPEIAGGRLRLAGGHPGLQALIGGASVAGGEAQDALVRLVLQVVKLQEAEIVLTPFQERRADAGNQTLDQGQVFVIELIL